jgi:VanZ family protein
VENNVRPRKWQWLWPLAIALLIISASNRPRLASTHVTNGDKVVHFAVYGLLATLVARLGAGWRGALVGLLVASAFGLTDEFHQSFVPHRSADPMDWVADTLGAALAVTLYAGWPWYRRCLEHDLRQRRIENAAPTPTIAGR